MNMLHATGNIGKDAVLRNTNSGSVANFSVAMKAGYGNSEETQWVNCSVWGKRADTLAQYLTKGTKVAIAGEVRLRSWTTQDGVVKTDLDCRVSELTLMGSPEDKPKSAPAAAQQDAYSQAPTPDLGNDIDDDVPF